MWRLSSPNTAIRDHYDVVVVGSGYGGAIAASRLARAKKHVCLLERGREIALGEFPDTSLEALSEIQCNARTGRHGPRTGLFEFHINDDINALVGCGLGGTSLINANVSIEPDDSVWKNLRWPRQLLADRHTLLSEGFRRARAMLQPNAYPSANPKLLKLEALRKAAQSIGPHARFYEADINVRFEDGPNAVGVDQKACDGCGDCVSGCNLGSKNTTQMNYLPDAWNHGAEIFTQTCVRHISRVRGRWAVHYQRVDMGLEVFNAPTAVVFADVIVLAAGTLGSTEILLRSRDKGLPLSGRLGERFSGNADVLGFSYNGDDPVNGIGWGGHRPSKRDPVGPCITGIIDTRGAREKEDRHLIEEGAIPSALASLMPLAMSAAGTQATIESGSPFSVQQLGRITDSALRGPYHGATRNTLTFLVMGHEGDGGRLTLDRRGFVRISWPGVGKQAAFRQTSVALKNAAAALAGIPLINPILNSRLQHGLITVHPLGGCAMADQADDGVVNHKGQIYSGVSGTAVHDGLYVADGAVIPVSLGANPLLTISAIAERTCALIARDRGWIIDYDSKTGRPRPAPETIGIRFTETMKGHFVADPDLDFDAAERVGRENDSKMAFVVTIESSDLDRFMEEPDHEARLVGTVTCPALSARPLTATDGRFNLFRRSDEQVQTRNMIYRMKLTTEEGRQFYLHGFKTIREGSVLSMWPETTTLYVTVHEGEHPDGPAIGKGVLHIEPVDFLHQLHTLTVTNAPDAATRLRKSAEFGDFFAEALVDAYGGILAGSTWFDPEKPPRKRRPLRAPAPTFHPLKTADDVSLLLTRYRGGTKGPVMLTHGLGVSSKIFTIDTIDTNLLEFLVANEYDVWLLDFRASIELSASQSRFTGDDVAQQDYPAAIDYVRRTAEVKDVQVVAHCFGATTFCMAMLSGLSGVRSAVCSQIATHIEVPTSTDLKAGIHLPHVLRQLGVDSLTALAQRHGDWQSRLFDEALRFLPIEPEERCRSATCHRITFLYAPLYEHDQLNTATHDALAEMFGVANIEAFEHLALLARRHVLVAADGSDRYMPHLDRMAIPIAFIHGEENACFEPKGTELTMQALSSVNGADLYHRHLIPGYGHIDCIFGKNAAVDVYPFILEHLEESARG